MLMLYQQLALPPNAASTFKTVTLTSSTRSGKFREVFKLNLVKMARNGDPAQDLDITILPDSEKPKNVADSGDMLPHFQFLDGRGSLQNSSERPIEGFVALKITYEHVLKKQREQARMLQQKDQQLASLKEQLKREKGMVQRIPSDDILTDELIKLSNGQALAGPARSLEKCSNQETKDLHLELAILKENKTKLRSGLVRLATFLLNKVSPNTSLAEVLKKIIENLQSLECDSEEAVRHLCALVEEMYNMDDSDKFEYIPESGQRQKAASCSSKDASLQRIVNNYQQTELPDRRDFESQTETTQDQEPNDPGQLERVKSQDEDMYGAEDGQSPDDSDLVPYNWIRLHFKLMKLQQMPSDYRSLAQQLSSISMQQQGRASNSSNLLPPRSIGTENKPVSSASGPPSSQMSSFVGIPSIKMPPSDLHEVGQLGTSQKNAGDTMKYVKRVEEVPRQVSPRRKPSPAGYTPSISETGSTQVMNASSPKWQQPISGKPLDQRFSTNDTRLGYGMGSNDALYSQARDPPSRSGASNYPVVSSVYNLPPTRYVDHQQTHNNQRFDYSPTAINSRLTEATSAPLTTQTQRHIPSPAKNRTSNFNQSELTMEYPQSPYLPGSGSTRDQLVTAHTVMRNMSVDAIECPVCSEKFPQGTPEQTVARHVNSHFEEDFEVLEASS